MKRGKVSVSIEDLNQQGEISRVGFIAKMVNCAPEIVFCYF
jgi:hypothetical protein